MNIGCIVMAAGMSSRFGGNKLAQEWQGKSLIRHALEAVPTDRLSAVMVVTQYPEVVALAKEFFFTPIVNSHPEYGQSHTSIWASKRWTPATRCCFRWPTSRCCGVKAWRS